MSKFQEDSPADSATGTPSAPLTARQRAIFERLLTRFLESGFSAFTIDSAAQNLHCSKSTLYALGPTRDAILSRILVSFFRQVAARTDAARRGHETHTAELSAYFQAIVQAIEPASSHFMRDLATDPVGQEIYDLNTVVATRNIREILEAGVSTGEFRSVSTEFTAQIVETAMQRIRQGDFEDILPVQEAYGELGELILRGVLA